MKKYFLVLLVFTLAFSFIPRNFNIAYADGECTVVKDAFEPNLWIADLGVSRTVLDVFTSVVFTPVGWIYGVGADDLVGCEGTVNTKVASFTSRVQEEMGGNVPATTTCAPKNQDACDMLLQNNETTSVTFSGNTMLGDGSKLPAYQKSINGSLLGMSNQLERYVKNEAPPVSLAYAWNQTVSRVPFANKVLAATRPEDNLPLVKVSGFAWKFSRNIALGLMSIILLYTGIMIVMRKKVNAQLVVSVQYAIPKILLGIVLIIFSYSIGALIASIGWGVFKGGELIIYKAFGVENVSSGLVIVDVAALLMKYTLGSIPSLIMLILMGVFVILMKIVFYFKALLIYLKIVFSIITAPVEIALGTVPGSESRITDWFTRMAKYAVTLLLMGMIVPLTLMLAMGVVLSLQSNGSEVGGFGLLMSVLAPLVIIVFGFFVGLSVEGKVDAMFSSNKKR